MKLPWLLIFLLAHIAFCIDPSPVDHAPSGGEGRWVSSVRRSRPVDLRPSSVLLTRPPDALFTCRGGARASSRGPAKGRRQRRTTADPKGVRKLSQSPGRSFYSNWIAPVLRIYTNIQLITRLYLSLALLLSLLQLKPLSVDPSVFALEWERTVRSFEFWRPFTAMAFQGDLTLSMISTMYFMWQYGQSLEEAKGSAEQLVFMLTQVILLSLIGFRFQLPFTGRAFSSALVYACSRREPFAMVPVFLNIRVQYWKVPFAQAVIDVLSAQKINAAIPHLMGIATGHFYHFFNQIYPGMGGYAWLSAPRWLRRRIDSDKHVYEPLSAAGSKRRGDQGGNGKRRFDKGRGRRLGG